MKFRITDEFGEVTEVEEIKEETPTEDEEPEVILSKEEIIALKSLIPHIEEIKALFEEEKKEEVEDDEEEKEIVGEEVEEEIHEDDEDIEEEIDEDEDKEEVIDTDEEEEEKDKIHDSIGAIGKQSARTNDAAFDAQEDIATAWANRYNGGNK